MELETLPTIAKKLGVTSRRLEYAAQRYSVEPARRVGIVRLYGPPQQRELISALKRIAGGKVSNV